MHPEEFVAELDRSVHATLTALGDAAGKGEPGPDIGVAELLATALKKELEASEEAALWMARENDVEVKLALARQCGDEAKHYRLIEARLRELGAPAAAPGQQVATRSPMFRFLEGLESTVERIAAGPFTREALAGVHNRVFIEFCESKGDGATASLYRDIIQPDEAHHHELGRRLLLRLAVTDDDQKRARLASEKTLAIASEIQETVRLKQGIARAPGC